MAWFSCMSLCIIYCYYFSAMIFVPFPQNSRYSHISKCLRGRGCFWLAGTGRAALLWVQDCSRFLRTRLGLISDAVPKTLTLCSESSAAHTTRAATGAPLLCPYKGPRGPSAPVSLGSGALMNVSADGPFDLLHFQQSALVNAFKANIAIVDIFNTQFCYKLLRNLMFFIWKYK